MNTGRHQVAGLTRRVLLVDPDVDALGALASALRAHGLMVTNASEPFDAVEMAFQIRPDVVLVAEELDRDREITEAFRAVPELAETPILSLVEEGSALTLPASPMLASARSTSCAFVSGANRSCCGPGRHRLHGRKPSRSADAARVKKRTCRRCGVGAGHTGRQ